MDRFAQVRVERLPRTPPPMAFRQTQLLGVEVMKEEHDGCGDQKERLSATVLKENDDFRQFAERMELAGKVYFLIDKTGVPKRLSCDDDDASNQAQSAGVRNEWLDCCLRDYLQRKQQFDRRCGSRQKVVLRIIVCLVPFLLFLWYFWPLWDFLIDVDAEVFFKTLGISPNSDLSEIKRAYREQVKQWHPDVNPGCGEQCRAQMRKIQQAHDVLMARGDHRTELANRYRDELLQVRSLVFFRVYSMAGHAAHEVFNIVVQLMGSRQFSNSTSSLLRTMCCVSTILFFTVYETLYVGGFSFVMIIQVFFLVVTMASSAKQEDYVAKARKVAYVDTLREAVVFILPITLVGLWVALTQSEESNRLEELFRVAFGCFYVAAYLYRFMPNIYDNLRKRSCTITMNYFRNIKEPVVSFFGVSSAEVGFLVDDLFAFTCRVPSPFRLAVFVSHFIYMCEFAMLPWEGPLRTGKADVGSRGDSEASNPVRVKGQKDEEPTLDNPVRSSSPYAETKPAVVSLSQKDFALVAALDKEKINWHRVAAARYQKAQIESMVKYVQRNNVVPLGTDVVACADFESVGIVVTAPLGVATSSSVPGTKTALKHDVVGLFKDPAACRLLALDSGPLGMIPPPNTSPDVDNLRIMYRKKFGSNAAKSPSTIWRSRDETPEAAQAREKTLPSSVVSIAVLFVLTFICFVWIGVSGQGRSPAQVFRSTAIALPKSLQPFAHMRFTRVFAPEHPVNSVATGLITLIRGRLILCTIDIWDAARQLHLYGREQHRQQ